MHHILDQHQVLMLAINTLEFQYTIIAQKNHLVHMHIPYLMTPITI